MSKQEVAYIERGNYGPILHFAHANAYPPAAYRQLLDGLSAHYHVFATEYRPLWPNSNPDSVHSWRDFARDLIETLDRIRLGPVIGVGHSLGAVTTMMASIDRPDLFNSLILIEPVFLQPQVLNQFATNQSYDPYQHPLVKIANKRRRHWNSRQEAFEQFREKRVFARFSDQALWDYVQAGLAPESDSGYTLTFPPEWEAWIYAHPPTTVWDLIPNIHHPTLGIRAGESATLLQDSWAFWMEKQPQAVFEEVYDTSHLLPMEKPESVVAIIRNFLSSISLP